VRRPAVLIVLAICLACGDTAGPRTIRYGQLAIAPVVASTPVTVVEIASAHLRLTRVGGTAPFLDTVITFSPGQTEFEVRFTVPISGESETLLLSLVLLDSAGIEVYRDEGDPTRITVSASADAALSTVPIQFVGPGAGGVRLEILEHTAFVYASETVLLNAVAYDAQDQPIEDARVGWMTLDPLVSVEDAKRGLVSAGEAAGTARVVAMLPRVREGAPLVSDTATVTVRINQAPDQVTIISPTDGSLFVTGSAVLFEGWANDPEDGALSGGALQWESDLDGAIGSGTSFTKPDLSAGAHRITLSATDSRSASSTTSVAITLAEAATITTTALPGGIVGVVYGAQLEAVGGTGTYLWSLGDGLLPEGLQLSADGTITGTPTAAGTATFTIQVESGGATDTGTFAIAIETAATTTTITSDDPDPSAVGAAVTVEYTVTSAGGSPTGDVLVTDGVDSCTGTVAGGSCPVLLTTPGMRTLTAAYAGDANFSASSDSAEHLVAQAPTVTTITTDDPDPSAVGETVTVSYTVTSDGGTPTGDVSVTDGVSSCTGTVAGGSCALLLTTPGTRTLTAAYAGDESFAASSDTEPHVVAQAPTVTTITSDDPDPSVVGETVTVIYTVTSNGGPPTGDVLVTDGVNSCSGTVAGGSCALLLTTPGPRNLTASYVGDESFAASSDTEQHVVVQAPTVTTITSDDPDPSTVGETVTVFYSVTSNGGTPTGDVLVTDGVTSCMGTVAAGSCALTLTTSGIRTLTASYAGNAAFASSSSVGVPHTVNKVATTSQITGHTPEPSAVGAAVSVTYTVTAAAGTPTGYVTVSDGVDSCVGTVAAGTCAITYTSAGTRTLTAAYEGDANFAASTSAGVTHTVGKATTTTTIVGHAPNPSTVGAAVAVSFTVTSAGGTPTGEVTVSDGESSCVGTVAAGTCELTLTRAGVRTLTAAYAGDGNFAASTSVGAAHTVSRANTATTIVGHAPDPSTVGAVVAVSFTVTSAGGTPTGDVMVSDGVDSCVGTVAAGTCVITLTKAGTRTLAAIYSGADDFNGSTSAGVPHTVNKASTTTTLISHTPDPSEYNGAVAVAFTVTSTGGEPTGDVTVSDGVDSCVGSVAAGTCALTLTTLGTRTLTASYAGSDDFNNSTSAGMSHTVTAAQTTTALVGHVPDPSQFNEAVAVTFAVTSVAGTPTGDVTVSDGLDSCVGTVESGTCALTLTTLGTRTLTATYAGDGNFAVSSDTAQHVVQQAATTTTITDDSPDPSLVGQLVTVSYTVTSGGGTPDGNVTVTVSGGSEQCSGSLSQGQGSCQLVIARAGEHTLTAAYGGAANFSGSSNTAPHVVNPAATTTTITGDSPDPSTVGQSVTVSYTVTSSGGTPTGGVTVTVSGGSEQCTGALSVGEGTEAVGSCTLTITRAGQHTLTAAYGGDTNFSGSSGTQPHVVNPAATTTTITSDDPDPSVVGQLVTVSYTVTSNGGTPEGDVTVTVSEGSEQCSGSLSVGEGTEAVGSCALTITRAGQHTLTAAYGGDTNFGGSSGTEPHVVNPASTTTTIISDTPDPSVVGQLVTVGYTVTSNGGTPEGDVTVTVSGGSEQCSGSLSEGQGSCQLAIPRAGQEQTLTATYSGDANFGSSSDTEPHAVNPAATTTTITSDSPDPSTVGQVVTVGFTVISSGGTPTGDVTVTGGGEQCTGSLSVGEGTEAVGACALTLTAVGGWILTATYAGDGNFAASSDTAQHVVTRAATTTTITGDGPDPSTVGQSVAVSYMVTSSSGTPTGSVTVTVIGGSEQCTGTLSQGEGPEAIGSCALTITRAGQEQTLTATYSGDANFGSSSDTEPHAVNPAATVTTIVGDSPDPSSVGQAVAVDFVVTSGGGTPTGDVTVTVTGGTEQCTGSLSQGEGTEAIGACLLTLTAAGARTLTATYGGDADFLGSSGTEPHTVEQQAAPTITLASYCVQPRLFRFTVELSDIPAGQNIFRIGADDLAFVTPNERIAINFDGTSGALMYGPLVETNGTTELDRWQDGDISNYTLTALGAGAWLFQGSVIIGANPFVAGNVVRQTVIRSPGFNDIDVQNTPIVDCIN